MLFSENELDVPASVADAAVGCSAEGSNALWQIPELTIPASVLNESLSSHILRFSANAKKSIYGISLVDDKYLPEQFQKPLCIGKCSSAGVLKVGETTRTNPMDRILEQCGLGLTERNLKMVFWAPAYRADGSIMSDTDLHRRFEQCGFRKSAFGSGHETYEIDVEDLWRMYAHEAGIETSVASAPLWPHQAAAVEKICRWLQSPDGDGVFLLAVRPRGGKTRISLAACVRLNAKRILIISFKPVNLQSWADECRKIPELKDAKFIAARKGKNGSIDLQYESADKEKIIVCYVSWQDLHNGEKKKHEFLKSICWDAVLWDEYHYGSYKGNPRRLFFDGEFVQFKAKKHIFITGTADKFIGNGVFRNEQIFTWSYFDERKAIRLWNEKEQGRCIYAENPKIHLLMYDMTKIVEDIANEGEFNEFSLDTFFEAFRDEDGICRFSKPQNPARWLDAVSGCNANPKDVCRGDSRMYSYPWVDLKLRAALKHTLLVLPSIAACEALAEMMKNHPFFRMYRIINCSGKGTGSGIDALNSVERQIGNPECTLSITLTCRKLIDSVTVYCWSGVCFLCDIESQEMYTQAGYRGATAWLASSGIEERRILKQDCYIIDFSPFRAIRTYSSWLQGQCPKNASSLERRAIAAELLKELPILAFDGRMREISVERFLTDESRVLSADISRNYFGSAYAATSDPIELKRAAKDPQIMAILAKAARFAVPDLLSLPRELNNCSILKKAAGKAPVATANGKPKEVSLKLVQKCLAAFASRIPLAQMLADSEALTLRSLLNSPRPDLVERAFFGLSIEELNLLADSNLLNLERIERMMAFFSRTMRDKCSPSDAAGSEI